MRSFRALLKAFLFVVLLVAAVTMFIIPLLMTAIYLASFFVENQTLVEQLGENIVYSQMPKFILFVGLWLPFSNLVKSYFTIE